MGLIVLGAVLGCATGPDDRDELDGFAAGSAAASDGVGDGAVVAGKGAERHEDTGTNARAAARVTINEIESDGGVPGDWVELVNTGTLAANLSGWRFRDNDSANVAYVFPAGTTLPIGGYLVLHAASFGFGLGAADSARLYTASGTIVDSYTWTSHALFTVGRCADGTGAFRATVAVTPGAANDCSTGIKLNELESTAGVPGDWAELTNTAPVTIDLSGWVFKDNTDTHTYVLPSGTTLAPGGFLVLNQASWAFSLGDADAARIYNGQGRLLDSFTWTTPAATTYGRCPDGTGAFTTTTAVTKGAANTCGAPPPPVAPWPGQNAVVTVDESGMFPSNLSDLFHAPAGLATADVLWAVRNDPSVMYGLVWNGAAWAPEPGTDWEAGKTLRYPDGTGRPDAEGMTRAEPSSTATYVATERDNAASGVSRLSVLRYDPSAPGAELIATHEWNLTADLPVVGSNLGLEAITWIPDTFLVASGFFDEAAGHVYQPSEYPGHGTGLFFVGVEATGAIHVYALDHASAGFARLATIASGHPGVMSLVFDRDVGYLWAACDLACAGQTAVLTVDATPASPTFGRFTVRRKFTRPGTMPNVDNEGIAIAPESSCVAGFKPFYWTEDGSTGGHALRADSIPCGAFVP